MYNTKDLRNYITECYAVKCFICNETIKIVICDDTKYPINSCIHNSFTYNTVIGNYESLKTYINEDVVLGYCVYTGNPKVVYEVVSLFPSNRRYFYVKNRKRVDCRPEDGLHSTLKIADYIDKMSTAYVNDFWQYDCRFHYL